MRGERLLAAGLVTLVVAGGLFGFVFIGLLGLALFPIGFLLLVIGVAACRNTSVSAPQARRGGFVAWAGVAMLTFSLWRATEASYATAVHRNFPDPIIPVATLGDWILAGGVSLAAAALLAGGIYLRTGWVRGRVLGWFFAAAAVCPAAVALFFLLSRWLDYTV